MDHSFSVYLAPRRHPPTAWGNLVRWHLRTESFPPIEDWAALRDFVGGTADRSTAREARATWRSYLLWKRSRVARQDAQHLKSTAAMSVTFRSA